MVGQMDNSSLLETMLAALRARLWSMDIYTCNVAKKLEMASTDNVVSGGWSVCSWNSSLVMLHP